MLFMYIMIQVLVTEIKAIYSGNSTQRIFDIRCTLGVMIVTTQMPSDNHAPHVDDRTDKTHVSMVRTKTVKGPFCDINMLQ